MSIKPLNIDALVAELLPELLPEVIVDIAALVGYKNALKLVQALGGIDFAMPTGDMDSKREQQLVNAVGEEAAAKLIKRYGGERLYIPRCHAAFIQLRNQEFRHAISMAVASGQTQTAAIHIYAPQYGFTERWAYNVLSEENTRADNQFNLFN